MLPRQLKSVDSDLERRIKESPVWRSHPQRLEESSSFRVADLLADQLQRHRRPC